MKTIEDIMREAVRRAYDEGIPETEAVKMFKTIAAGETAVRRVRAAEAVYGKKEQT